MAKVEWSAGIDSVSGALSKPGKNGQHSCAKMLLFMCAWALLSALAMLPVLKK